MPKLLMLYQDIVPSEWIDYNGHMNIAYYVLAFDRATDAFMDNLGMGQTYREQARCSTFVVETHVNFHRELKAGDRLTVTTQLLGFDSKRIHYFHRMFDEQQDTLVATTELMLIHVDLTQRRSIPMPLTIMDRLNAVMAKHLLLPRPPQTGRVMGIRSKPLS
ncbi:MAG: thioesterase family protein [Candidatus Competibacteraceae bacterium]|jgi:acyl-CoA thioester hydrolase|nr:thioesterase family protein [Candidatus Competibacteraceae bacterium]